MAALDIAYDFVRKHEGCRLQAYQDLGGVWTIGYGHTDSGIKQGLVWTQDQANSVLMIDLRAASVAIESHVISSLNDQQTAAVTSFVFNLGIGAFSGSTLLKLINAGDYIGAAKQFPLWDHVGPQEIKGLLIRRLEEALLFLGVA
jgi:lysozyme